MIDALISECWRIIEFVGCFCFQYGVTVDASFVCERVFSNKGFELVFTDDRSSRIRSATVRLTWKTLDWYERPSNGGSRRLRPSLRCLHVLPSHSLCLAHGMRQLLLQTACLLSPCLDRCGNVFRRERERFQDISGGLINFSWEGSASSIA